MGLKQIGIPHGMRRLDAAYREGEPSHSIKSTAVALIIFSSATIFVA